MDFPPKKIERYCVTRLHTLSPAQVHAPVSLHKPQILSQRIGHGALPVSLPASCYKEGALLDTVDTKTDHTQTVP